MDGVIASWVGNRLALTTPEKSGPEGIRYLAVDASAGLPKPDSAEAGARVDVLLWPLEQLLQRPFRLPLSQPKLVDVAVLEQELKEQTGEEPERWWPAWRAWPTEGGVRGLMFAMPAAVKAAIADDPLWRECRFIGVDAWPRLALHLADPPLPCAVIDADADGLFCGYYGRDGWLGMRRLNHQDARDIADLAEDAVRSLTAMGYQAEKEPACGRIDGCMSKSLLPQLPEWRGEVVASLPDRTVANIAAASLGDGTWGPNFRHGAWAIGGAWRERLKPWRPSLVLAAGLLLALMAHDAYTLHALRRQQAELRQDIVEAFHQSLPDEPAMIDPLAQMRRAAGVGAQGGDPWAFLRQMQSVAQLKKSVAALHIEEVNFDGDVMYLKGSVPDLATVNRIRNILAGVLQKNATVEDMEMKAGAVRFRVQWRY